MTSLTILTKRQEFVTCSRDGVYITSKGLVLQAFCRENISDDKENQQTGVTLPRFGYTVTKKVGKAVVRNRIKRRLRALTRETYPLFRPGYDYVLIGRKATLERPFINLIKDLKYTLHQVHKE